MGYGTASVALATTPTVIGAFFKHLLTHRAKRRDGLPEAEVSYDEGIQIVRSFLRFASKHTVEELQSFTKAKVPVPSWVIRAGVEIGQPHSDKAADILRTEFEDLDSTEAVGGTRWWTFRSEPLLCEWVEMKKSKLQRELEERKAQQEGRPVEPLRVLLYIHGGAHHFSSLDTHRYQVQRHARKFGAKAFSPSYRLAPQFPFPCQLHDALTAYLYLTEEAQIQPSQIIVSGDSAGGGTALALLCVLRDRGLPMPAGGCLISPWLDMTHSFPSVAAKETVEHDYIPSCGFHYKPSLSWPPPLTSNSMELEVQGKKIQLSEQLQLHAPNNMLDHPLVSLVNQGSLGGLPPLCIVHGNAELLRDEQIYAAHKAAHPAKYPPAQDILDRYPSQRRKLGQYPPTKVHLLTFDGSCHVLPTLAFATPAKYMYRAAASFNLWAVKLGAKTLQAKQNNLHRVPSNASLSHIRHTLENALLPEVQRKANDVPDDVSLGSEASDDSDMEEEGDMTLDQMITVTGAAPKFKDSMVRERVNTSGRRRPMEPESELACLNMDPKAIGHIGDALPIRRWLEKQAEMDKKYGKLGAKLRQQKEEEYERAKHTGFLTKNMQGERPPRSSIVCFSDPTLAMKCARAQSSYGRTENTANAIWAKLSAMPDEAEAGQQEVQRVSDKLKKTSIPGAAGVGDRLADGSRKVVDATTGKPEEHHKTLIEAKQANGEA